MDTQLLSTVKIGVLVVVLSALYILEILIPYFVDRKEKGMHALRNLSLGACNAVVISVLFAGALLYMQSAPFTAQFGLLNIISVPLWAEVLIAILLFDLWMYSWHVINHKVPLLWRFHRVHHSDPQVDATSALRFHTGEIILSTIARLGIIAIMGLHVWHIILYEIILLPVILFHHSNVKFPEKYDRVYRLLFASPHMHWIHHSDKQPETDSNYGSIFSFWDRLFATFRLRKSEKEYKKIRQGLTQYPKRKWENMAGMLRIPFLKK